MIKSAGTGMPAADYLFSFIEFLFCVYRSVTICLHNELNGGQFPDLPGSASGTPDQERAREGSGRSPVSQVI